MMSQPGSKKVLKDLVRLTKEYIEQGGHLLEPKFLTVKNKTTLQDLEEKYAYCQRCPLSRSRTHLVFGKGNPRAKLVFVGEAPGREEDLQGYPFVGQAGKLLDKIFTSIGLERKALYITNILKCRPPNNRNPEPEEISTCQPIFWEQLEVIQPKLICALGKFAAQTILNSEEKIGNLRGRWFELKGINPAPFCGFIPESWYRLKRCGIKLLVTYHPAYLLRNPQDKRLVWEDMKKLKAAYEKIIK